MCWTSNTRISDWLPNDWPSTQGAASRLLLSSFGKRFGDGFHVRLGSDEDGNRRHRFILGADLIFDLEDPLSNPGDNVFILEIFP